VKESVMATARVNGLLFEGWWREAVVVEEGASVRFVDLYRAYSRAVGTAMGRSAFVARLNGMKLRETKRKGERWRHGVRLREGATAPHSVASEPFAPARDFAAAGPLSPSAALRQPPPSASRPPPPASPREDEAPPAPALYRLSSIAPGEADEVGLMLEIGGPDDHPSARVAHELFAARQRQRAPVAEGGEGYSNTDDDRYAGQLAMAASAYAFAAGQPPDFRAFIVMNGKPERPSTFGWQALDIVRRLWPWDVGWWKPKTPRADLVRAGALIIAAIEKIDRAEARGRLSADEQRTATGV
jgi:hypothetical protein